MDNLRREQLFHNWNTETDDPETTEWRDELTLEELEYIAQLDEGYRRGMLCMCQVILIREEIRRRFHPQEILELEAVRDHCRLRLRDGRLFLARWTSQGQLRLDEIEEAC